MVLIGSRFRISGRALVVVGWLGISLAAVGCVTLGASGSAGSASAGSESAALIELDGTRWWQPTNDGQMDGRAIEIKKEAGQYVGKLTDIGRKLSGKVGAYSGAKVMEFHPGGRKNEFAGEYIRPGEQGESATFSVSADGQELKCSIDDNAWRRRP